MRNFRKKRPVDVSMHDVTDDVIRSKNRSNIEMAVTSLICELDHRSKAQNVGNTLGYLDNIANFRWHISWKSSSRRENFVTFQFFQYSIQLKFHITDGKTISKLCTKNVFHVHDVTSDVTALRQSQSSIFMFKWNWHIFTHSSQSLSYIFTKCHIQMHPGLVHRSKAIIVFDLYLNKRLDKQ